MEIIKTNTASEQEIIRETIAVLKRGGLIVFPTETCYGLGVDATSQEAVDKLFQYKTRREGKPFSIAVADEAMARKYVEINETAQNLYDKFLPGPLTVVSRGKHVVAHGVESEVGTLGIRIPAHSLILTLIKNWGKPITATSANVSYAKKPYSFSEWKKYTPAKNQKLIDLFLDAGRLPVRPVSTVVDATLSDLEIVRQGEIKLEKQGGKTVLSNSDAQTQDLGFQLTKKYHKELAHLCLLFSLQGDLGTGKTQFAKGVAKALGITHTIISPTFVLVREYPYRIKKLQGTFFHLDTWRLFEAKEIEDLGIEKMGKPGNVIVIEWAEKAAPIIKNLEKQQDIKIVWITLKHVGENGRKIRYS